MDIMGTRHQTLEYMIEGYKKSGIDLVGYDGSKYVSGNEIGGDFFIPGIVHYFGLPLDQAIYFFYLGIILVALALGIVGFFLLYKKWYQRLISILGLITVSFLTYRIGDVYTAYSSIVIAFVPFIIYFFKNDIKYKYLIPFTFIVGLFATLANSIRSQAGIPVAIFLIVFLFLNKFFDIKKKAVLVGLLIIGSLLPVVYFNSLVSKRDTFLAQNVPNYTEIETTLSNQGAFWHSIYIGFGFLDNPYGIRYEDGIANGKVQSIKPGTPYLSKEYQNILKSEVFKLMLTHPDFAMRTIAAKLGVIVYYLLRFSCLGVLLAIFYRKDLQLDIAFFFGFLFSTVHGIAVMPCQQYLLGFIAFSAIYGVISINFAIENGLFKDISSLLKERVFKKCAE